MTIEPGRGMVARLKRALSTIDWTRVREVAKDGLELAPKLAAPAAVIVAALLAQSFQSSMTVSQMLSQREQSDTQIRAEMFKAITERLLESHGNEAPERKAVFTELLALNFHEHIELKPLLVEVDNALLEKRKQAGLTKQQIAVVDGQREEMRSVARRVRARQTALLERAAPPERTWGAWAPWARAAEAERKFQDGDLRFIGVRFSGARAPEFSGAADAPPPPLGVVACDVPKEEGYNVCALEPVIENTPDDKGAIAVSLTGADWDRQTFTVLVKRSARFDPTKLPPADGSAAGEPAPPCGTDQKDRSQSARDSTAGSSVLEFQTSWFDFPLTDNTLLSTGSRYAIYVDQVCYDRNRGVKAVKLGLLWFPRDYFPARERPTNYRQLREKLRLPSVRE
jgi:hypothetical protein